MDILKENEEKTRRHTKKVSIMFVDMAQSALIKEEKGISRGIQKTILHNTIVSKVIIKKGKLEKKKGLLEEVKIHRFIGDAVMAYFVGKNASQISVETANEIHKELKNTNESILDELEKLKTKIGIDCGIVNFYEFFNGIEEPYGVVIDIAKNLTILGKPGQTLVSKNVKSECNLINFRRGGNRILKGVTTPSEVFEVIF